MRNTLLSWLINTVKGMFIGMANAIPGVSGGTIAVITGIYEPLIDALGSVFSRTGQWRVKIPAVLPLLVPVLVGVFLGIALFANLVETMFENIPMQTRFLFMGLILGSLPCLIQQSARTKFRWTYLIPMLLCLGLLLWMAVANAGFGDTADILASQSVIREITPFNALVLIFVGMVATGTMVIPGVSGSFFLVIIGMYATFVKMFTQRNIPVILLFMVGAILGLLITSRIISLLLSKVHGHSYYGIIGLVTGSVASLWPGFAFTIEGYTSIAAFLLGFAGAYFLGAGQKRVSPAKEGHVDAGGN